MTDEVNAVDLALEASGRSHDLVALAPLGRGGFSLGAVGFRKGGDVEIELVIDDAAGLGDQAPFGRLDRIGLDADAFGIDVAEPVCAPTMPWSAADCM